MKKLNMSDGLALCRETPGALLLDVRDPEEYAMGRIPGSVNLPLGRIREIGDLAEDLETPLFVYCLSGGRSSRACAALAAMDYEDVTDLGGIHRYVGELEK